MFDGSTMKGIRAAVSSYAASFEPAEISAQVAQSVVEDAIAVENMVATIKALAAKRVAGTELWKREGDISPAHHLARKAGTSVAKAKEELETAAGLSQLPELEAAARSGEVSSSQAGAIADAATKNPKAESRLVKKAKKSSLFQLKQECDAAKAAVERDPDARQAAIHRSRFLRQRRTNDGAGEVVYRSTLEEVAELMSIVRGYAQRVFEKARAEGRREPEEATWPTACSTQRVPAPLPPGPRWRDRWVAVPVAVLPGAVQLVAVRRRVAGRLLATVELVVRRPVDRRLVAPRLVTRRLVAVRRRVITGRAPLSPSLRQAPAPTEPFSTKGQTRAAPALAAPGWMKNPRTRSTPTMSCRRRCARPR